METTRQEQLRRQWMDAGVTFEDAQTVYLSEEATIGPDTVVGPNTHIKGKTVIGSHCRIDGNAYIENCTIGDDVRIYFSVVLSDSQLSDGSSAGRFHICGAGPCLPPTPRSAISSRSKNLPLASIPRPNIWRISVTRKSVARPISARYDYLQL